MKYKSCIFDLDGTLLNTIDSIAHYANKALNEFGYRSIGAERYKRMVGDGAETLIRRAVEYLGGGADANIGGVLECYNRAYNADSFWLTTVYDGVYDLLDYLKDTGVGIAVLSNKPHDTTLKVVERFFGNHRDGGGYFDVVLGARRGKPLKPSPEGVFEILDALQVKQGECLYIGDTATDMLTGNAAGVDTVGVLWGFRGEAELKGAHAGRIISRPEELKEMLERSK